MPEQPGGADVRPDDAPSSSNNNRRRQNNNNITINDNRQSRRSKQTTRGRYEGKVETLRKHVYDVTHGKASSDLFATTTREIAEYITRNFKGGGEFLQAMDPDTLAFETLVDPMTITLAADASVQAVEAWKMSLRQYSDQIVQREEVSKQAFAVVLGQCSQTVRERIRASTSWRTVNDNSDLMGLLRLVRESLYTGATTRHPIHSLQEAEEALMSFRQGDNMSNHVYYEKFKGLVERYEHHGGRPGQINSRIQHYLDQYAADAADPTPEETRDAMQRAKDEYLGVMLVRHSDSKRFGGLVTDLLNTHTRGSNQYPTTLSHGFDLLVNYQTLKSYRSFDQQDHGMAFINEEDQSRSQSGRGGHTGRNSRRGGSRGRGGNGGRGRGSNNGGRAEAHINDDGREELEDTENIDDNSSHSVASSYLHDLVDIVRAETYVTTHSPDNKT